MCARRRPAAGSKEKVMNNVKNNDDTNGQANELAGRLMRLHRNLEDQGDRGTDWSLARTLEGRIGSYQPVAGDFDRANQLLNKHGF